MVRFPNAILSVLLLLLHLLLLLLVIVMLRLDLIDHFDDFTVHLLDGLGRLVGGLRLDLPLQVIGDERGLQRLATAVGVHGVDPLLAHV